MKWNAIYPNRLCVGLVFPLPRLQAIVLSLLRCSVCKFLLQILGSTQCIKYSWNITNSSSSPFVGTPNDNRFSRPQFV
jgi:hypothetical protein